jgi:hypothetical protein
MIVVKVNNAAFILVAAAIYLIYFTSHFMFGIYAVFDILAKNFVTGKMAYIDSYIAANWFGLRSHYVSVDNRKNIGGNYHLKLLLANQKGKSVFSTTFFHKMEANKNYTVTYGKKSKIVLSIISEQGEEMLQFDVD